MKIKFFISAMILGFVLIGLVQVTKASGYKANYATKTVKIGKSEYKVSNGRIIRRKNGKTKVMVKKASDWFITNGKYIYYATGGKNWGIYNKLYRYNIKTKKSKYIFKVAKYNYIGVYGKKGQSIYYRVYGEGGSGIKFYAYDLKKRRKIRQ